VEGGKILEGRSPHRRAAQNASYWPQEGAELPAKEWLGGADFA
jgi:hypothetical protein